MKFFLYAYFLVLFINNNLYAQKIKSNSPEIVKTLHKKMQNFYKLNKEISYDFKIKYISNIENEKTNETGKVYIQKKSNDVSFLVQNITNQTLVIYLNKKATLIKNKNNSYSQIENIKQYFELPFFDYCEGLYQEFIYNQALSKVYYDSSFYCGIQNLNNIPCYKIKISSPYFKELETIYYFDTSRLFPLKIIYEYKEDIKEYNTTTSIEFTNIKFDFTDTTIFNEKKYIVGKKVKDYIKAEVKNPSKLIGAKFNGISGININTNRPFDNKSLENKIIIFDFWFINCYPCAKANQILKKLQIKYAANGLAIIGINSTDKVNNIKTHLKTFNTKYINLKVEKKVDEFYEVEAYPTLVCIGKNGVIKLIKTGISDNLEQELENFITQELKN